jgi:hypothetical protein
MPRGPSHNLKGERRSLGANRASWEETLLKSKGLARSYEVLRPDEKSRMLPKKHTAFVTAADVGYGAALPGCRGRLRRQPVTSGML